MADTQIVNGVEVALTSEEQAAKDAAAAAWAPSIQQVQVEREKRLALGFDYDFQDARGVHRIGTTEQDWKGWEKVTALAMARINRGSVAPIDIVTDTGPCSVTPLEWAAILDHAGTYFEQPIWAASFTIMDMTPIPTDYAADRHWGGT